MTTGLLRKGIRACLHDEEDDGDAVLVEDETRDVHQDEDRDEDDGYEEASDSSTSIA